MHQHGGNGAHALVQAGLNHRALGRPVRVGLELHHVGGKNDHLQQVVHALFGVGGNRHAGGVAAPLLGHQLIFRQLLLHPVRIGSHLIHLVDGHNNGNPRRLCVVDGLHGLGHNAIVRGHHQHGDVRYLRAPGPHGGKGRVAWGVQEG